MTARHALPADVAALERSLAIAFDDDPMMRWVLGDVPDAERLDRAVAGFFQPALAAGMRRGHAYTLAECVGASVWSPPGQPMFSDDEGIAFATAIAEHGGSDAVTRLIALGGMVDSHHPTEPHFYLFLLGTSQQGLGQGGVLMAPVLERCDQQGLPAYLESSNVRNVSFYERQGFRVLWEDRPEPDGPLFQGMWRDPR